MKAINLKLGRLISLFSRIENHLNESLSLILFGDAGESDYEDIPLPSERKPAQKKKVKNEQSKRSWGPFKRTGQLKLFFKSKMKAVLLSSINFCEKIILISRSRRVESSYENRYK